VTSQTLIRQEGEILWALEIAVIYIAILSIRNTEFNLIKTELNMKEIAAVNTIMNIQRSMMHECINGFDNAFKIIQFLNLL